MSAGADRFAAAAAALGLRPDVHRFPEGTKTAQDAARAIGCDVAQIVKSLVFVAGDRPVLALTSGANRVDTEKLATLAGAATSRRATPEEVREATGFAIGGTPPFVVASPPMEVYLDETLLGFDVVWAAAGTPDSVFPIAPADLLRVSGGTAASFTE